MDAASLSQVGIFRELPTGELNEIASSGKMREFAAGEVIMTQGDPGECLHIIVDGRVRVERSHPSLTHPVVLAELHPGEVVGEMGLLDRATRSASVVAITNTATFVISGGNLAQVIAHYPTVSIELLRTLSRRMRTTDDLVTAFASRTPDGGQPSPSVNQ
jgi:CRP/FNR family transcriptional regulator, cyclic AMP receptor protein